MKKRFGKADVILLSVIFFILILWVIFSFVFKKEGVSVVVTVEGKEYQTVPLSKDQEIEIKKDGTVINRVSIHEGKADMTEATCPDKLCVHQKPVSKSGETIVCLPHEVVVEVKGSEKGEFDSIAR